MFKKLFGSGFGTSTNTTVSNKAAQQQEINHLETMEHIDQSIANVDKRIKKLEADMRSLLQEALAKKKAKDTRGNITFS